MTEIIGYYYIAINIITFLLFAFDKRRAVQHRWRISEATLLGCSLIGGAFGGLISMHLFHHKTKKNRFRFGVPLMLVAQIGLFFLVFR